MTVVANSSNSTIPDYVISASEERALEIYFNVIGWLFFIPTVVGNSLILISIVRFRALRKVNHYIMIGNLAFSDLLVGMVVLPIDTSFALDDNKTDIFLACVIVNCMIYTCVAASVINLFILSLERFHAIQYPLHHPVRCTKKRIYIIIGITWLFEILVGFFPLVNYKEREKPVFKCRAKFVYTKLYQQVLISIILFCIIASCVFYLIIIRSVLKKLETFDDTAKRSGIVNPMHRKWRKDARHSRVMLLVSGLFIVFWAPYCIAVILPLESERFDHIKAYLAGLGLINSCLNWIIFGARLKKFKEAFRNILNCTCMKPDFQLRISSIT